MERHRIDDSGASNTGDLRALSRERLQHHAEESRHAIAGSKPVDRTTDSSAEKPDPAIQQREHEIERRYHVKFSKPGELLGFQFGGEKDQSKPSELRSRQPTQKELDGVEAALKHSYPAYLTRTGGPLKIEFYDKEVVKGTSAQALYVQPLGKEPAQLKIFPGAAAMPATEKDVTQRDPRNPNLDSLEGAVTHELGHGTEVNVTGHLSGKDAQYYRELGWVPLDHPPNDYTHWAIQAKDGSLYTHDGPDPTTPWMKLEGGKGYDSKGHYLGKPVDKDGKIIEPGPDVDPSWVPGDEVKKQMPVKPCSEYFTFPKEQMAESLAQFRLAPATRAKLLKESPKLYEATKKLDQQEMDLFTHGTKMRMPDGTVVEKDWAHRRRLKEWERQHY